MKWGRSQLSVLRYPLSIVFVYDGANNRIQQVDYTGAQPTTTTYTNDVAGLAQVLLASDGSTTTTNLFGLDLIFVDDGTTPRMMLADGLGSVRVEMVGDAVETITTYEPFGKLLAQTGTSGTTYGYTGEAHDAATGLVYLRARYYNPDLKIFMSRDPFPGFSGMPSTQHGYSYVSNNPTNRIDPSGLCEQHLPDEACWSIYEQIVRQYPEARNKRYYLNGNYNVKLHELPAGRLQNFLEELNNAPPC